MANQPEDSKNISGKAPTNKTLAKEAWQNDAIYGVTIGEDSDDPCYMEIKYRDLATLETQPSLTFSGCAGHKVGDLLTASLPSGVFATGVRICLNSDGDKLKGIQLIGAYDDCVLGAESVQVPNSCKMYNLSGLEYRICDPDGPPFKPLSCNIPITKFVERPNCQGSRHDEPDNDWEKIASCPPKMVATGMRLRTIDGSGNRTMIDGVALECDTLLPPRVPVPSGRRTETLQVDGQERSFIVYIPEGVRSTDKLPVVLMFHGADVANGDAEQFYNMSGWKEKADRERIVAVFPSSLQYDCVILNGEQIRNQDRWNDDKAEPCGATDVLADDVKFVRRLVDFLQKHYPTDPKRFYASGFSNGGSFTAKLAMAPPASLPRSLHRPVNFGIRRSCRARSFRFTPRSGTRT
ncbi:MAG: alpha/beta hydrolase-fold protein [Nitrospira sp.]|nr:alpha/beta hydrolase-fold protein [Nitrospira sp.]